MRKKAGFGVKSAESVFPGLKPYRFCWLYAGVETPASLRTEFFRSLQSPSFILRQLRPD